MLRALTLETRVQPVSAIASEAESRATKASARPNQGATKKRGASEPRQLGSMCTCAILGDPTCVCMRERSTLTLLRGFVSKAFNTKAAQQAAKV